MVTVKAKQSIPKEWQSKNFLDCVVVPSKINGLKRSEYKDFGKFPIFDQAQQYISGYTDREDLVQEKIPAILFGDHTRIIKYINTPYALGADGTKIFWAEQHIDPAFLYQMLLKLEIPNTGYNRHFKWLKEATIALPPLAEQKKIAQILSSIDEEVEKTDEIILKSNELKLGLMKSLFTCGIGNDKFIKVKLGDISDITKLAGFEYTKHFNSYKDGGDVIVVRGSNIKDNKLDISDIKTISLTVSDTLPRSQLKKGDLVFAYVGTIGPVALIDEDKKYHLGPNTARITPVKEITSKYLYWYFQSPLLEDEIQKRISITAQPSLSMEKIRDFEILLPRDMSVQNRITDIIDSVDDKITVNRRIRHQLVALKKGLMQDLLSGKKRTV